MVAGALKGAIFAANIYEKQGFCVIPNATEERYDIIQAIEFGKPEYLIAFCKGIQKAAPVTLPFQDLTDYNENIERRCLPNFITAFYTCIPFCYHFL